jgi:hypothetical protein
VSATTSTIPAKAGESSELDTGPVGGPRLRG